MAAPTGRGTCRCLSGRRVAMPSMEMTGEGAWRACKINRCDGLMESRWYIMLWLIVLAMGVNFLYALSSIVLKSGTEHRGASLK